MISFVCAISSRPHLFGAMHAVSLMMPKQEGRLMAATTAMVDICLLCMGERDPDLLFCVKHAWQLWFPFNRVPTRSWRYQLHLRITGLGIGNDTIHQ